MRAARAWTGPRWAGPVGRRLVSAAAAVLLSVLVCFALSQWAPGDALSQLELDPSIPPAALAAMRFRLLPSRSLSLRFADWSVAALHGDLGYSLQFHVPVSQLLRQRTPATLVLVAAGLGAAWALAFALSLLSAWLAESSRRRFEAALRGLATIANSALAALPLGLLAVLALLWAPPTLLGGEGWPWVAVVVLALGFLPSIYFQAVHALAAVLEAPYMMQARAAGIRPVRLVLRHALPNTSDVLIPVASVSITQALVEVVIVESLLGWPGLGQLALQAASGRDVPLLAALVLWTSLIVVGVNLASDLLQMAFNPRLRAAPETALA